MFYDFDHIEDLWSCFVHSVQTSKRGCILKVDNGVPASVISAQRHLASALFRFKTSCSVARNTPRQLRRHRDPNHGSAPPSPRRNALFCVIFHCFRSKPPSVPCRRGRIVSVRRPTSRWTGRFARPRAAPAHARRSCSPTPSGSPSPSPPPRPRTPRLGASPRPAAQRRRSPSPSSSGAPPAEASSTTASSAAAPPSRGRTASSGPCPRMSPGTRRSWPPLASPRSPSTSATSSTAS
jgi:hypothetical protein